MKPSTSKHHSTVTIDKTTHSGLQRKEREPSPLKLQSSLEHWKHFMPKLSYIIQSWFENQILCIRKFWILEIIWAKYSNSIPNFHWSHHILCENVQMYNKYIEISVKSSNIEHKTWFEMRFWRRTQLQFHKSLRYYTL